MNKNQIKHYRYAYRIHKYVFRYVVLKVKKLISLIKLIDKHFKINEKNYMHIKLF